MISLHTTLAGGTYVRLLPTLPVRRPGGNAFDGNALDAWSDCNTLVTRGSSLYEYQQGCAMIAGCGTYPCAMSLMAMWQARPSCMPKVRYRVLLSQLHGAWRFDQTAQVGLSLVLCTPSCAEQAWRSFRQHACVGMHCAGQHACMERCAWGRMRCMGACLGPDAWASICLWVTAQL